MGRLGAAQLLSSLCGNLLKEERVMRLARSGNVFRDSRAHLCSGDVVSLLPHAFLLRKLQICVKSRHTFDPSYSS